MENNKILIKKCPKCGRIGRCTSDYMKCFCGEEALVETVMSDNEYCLLCDISSDDDFLNAMIDLKEKDPIEFQLKMSQFKTQVQQQDSIKTQNDNTPRCPHCKSTNIKSISGLNRGASIAMWGIFSKKINKSFECKQCGYTW